MGKRALFGGLYAAVLIGVFGLTSFGPYLLAVFTLLLMNEVSRLLKMESKVPIMVFTFLVLLAGAIFDWGDHNDIVTSTIMLSTMLVLTLLRAKQPALEMRKSFFGLIYIYVPMIYVIQTAVKSPELILFIFILIWSSDTFAYLVGKGFGKHPFAPKLSPKKTMEGFVGGIIGTLIIGAVTNFFWGLTAMPIALSLAVTVSLIAPFGDLVASALKREADIKDSGVFLPGHGGALDRLDSFITAAPIAILIYQHLI